MMGLSSIKAGARMMETTIFGRAGWLHTHNSTSAGVQKLQSRRLRVGAAMS
jgi:hypothetical protein